MRLNEITKLFESKSYIRDIMILNAYFDEDNYEGEVFEFHDELREMSKTQIEDTANIIGVSSKSLRLFFTINHTYPMFLDDQHDGREEYAEAYEKDRNFKNIEEPWEGAGSDDPIDHFGKDFDLWLKEISLVELGLSKNDISDFLRFENDLEKEEQVGNILIKTYGIHGIKQIPSEDLEELIKSIRLGLK